MSALTQAATKEYVGSEAELQQVAQALARELAKVQHSARQISELKQAVRQMKAAVQQLVAQRPS